MDVEQVVIRQRLILGVVWSTRGDPASLRRSVGNTCSASGMEHEIVVGGPTWCRGTPPRRRPYPPSCT